jgi:hypothetical protein
VDAPVTFHKNDTRFSDAQKLEQHRRSVLRDGALPNAPVVMPTQVLETKRMNPVARLSVGAKQLIAVIAHGFPKWRGH